MKKNMSKFLTIVTIAILVCFNLSGCLLMPAEEEILAPPLDLSTDIRYITETVERGDIINSVSGTATFTYTERESLYFKSNGQLEDIYVRVGMVVNEGDMLASLILDDLERQIELQELNVRLAELDVENARYANATTKERVEIALERQNIILAGLQEQYDSAVIKAPKDGIITYVANIDEGDDVSALTPIIVVSNNNEMCLVYKGAYKSEMIAGLELEIEIKDVSYHSSVLSSPYDVPDTASDIEKEYCILEFDISQVPSEIKSGEQAKFHYIKEQSLDTLIIRKSLVNNYMGRDYVYVLSNGLKTERTVELGMATSTHVEILSGLEEGEEVIVR